MSFKNVLVCAVIKARTDNGVEQVEYCQPLDTGFSAEEGAVAASLTKIKVWEKAYSQLKEIKWVEQRQYFWSNECWGYWEEPECQQKHLDYNPSERTLADRIVDWAMDVFTEPTAHPEKPRTGDVVSRRDVEIERKFLQTEERFWNRNGFKQ